MRYRDLRDFIALLEQRGELKRIRTPVDPRLEVTEISQRTLLRGGPALLFEQPLNHSMPLLSNLFGTVQRVALGMGEEEPSRLRAIGETLAALREPEPPRGLKDAWEKWPL
ncbi:MAG TPA: UbiD family decarboxylase, partial [Pseudomonadales bacterium]|nr:UbiD family decarboxylase [Pseudomonadales bacterium]